jgi:hypothetical protein
MRDVYVRYAIIAILSSFVHGVSCAVPCRVVSEVDNAISHSSRRFSS